MITIGIDPGVTGAICLMEHGSIVQIWDMPTVELIKGGRRRHHVCPVELSAILQDICHPIGMLETMAVVEEVHSMPGQGVVSMFGMGRSLGVLEGVLAAQGWPVTMVRPQDWRRWARLSAGKDASVAEARRRWPGTDWFRLAKHHGRADAALIAAWWGGVRCTTRH